MLKAVLGASAGTFAEAFVGWLFEDSGEPDEETRCLFEYLAWD